MNNFNTKLNLGDENHGSNQKIKLTKEDIIYNLMLSLEKISTVINNNMVELGKEITKIRVAHEDISMDLAVLKEFKKRVLLKNETISLVDIQEIENEFEDENDSEEKGDLELD